MTLIQYIWYDSSPVSDTTFELLRTIRANVYRMKFRDQCYYLKYYKPQDVSKIIKNFFRSADAVRYFQTAVALQHAGVAVAEPVLALTRKSGYGLQTVSLLQGKSQEQICIAILTKALSITDCRE